MRHRCIIFTAFSALILQNSEGQFLQRFPVFKREPYNPTALVPPQDFFQINSHSTVEPSKSQTSWKISSREEGGKEEKPPEGEKESNGESEKGKDVEDSKEKLSPFDEVIKDVSKPEFYLPILNDLTFIALTILLLPLIIPLIIIPLSSYVVGSLLIPIVRANHLINAVKIN